MDLMWPLLLESFRITDRATENLEHSIDMHREVFKAIKAKYRARARRAMLKVLKQTEKDLLKRERQSQRAANLTKER